ncbi:MAG: YaiI/YqxD family protein [Rhodanobacter sp.]|nr:MAG: YaiI/YqxD family protein [Rhodanobacter sp.]TAM14535.1 MAG: YaiI/YqxD family protein [Rhodanobacter sp.]TAM37326.1 MAG: YaiI/YqxD family protein [Rhodanobacter sp.]
MIADPQILVDADACPVAIKEILFRAAERERIAVTLVANAYLRTPPSRFVHAVQVAHGFDVADHEIVRRVCASDLVVTQDIPLAAAVIEKGALALDPHGELHTRETIAQRLTLRNFMDELRSSGVDTGGHTPFHARDKQAFANQLDQWLQRRRPRAD